MRHNESTFIPVHRGDIAAVDAVQLTNLLRLSAYASAHSKYASRNALSHNIRARRVVRR